MTFQQDADALAISGARVTGRVKSEGGKALATTLSWADTIRAASYGEDKGGNRWEIDPVTLEIHPLPNDPTGEAVVAPDDVAQLHDRLKALMRDWRRIGAEIEHIYDQVSPDPSKRARVEDDPLDEDRWCKSCAQDRGRLTPVAIQTDDNGRVRVKFKGLCRWCHRFIQEYGRRPTPELIRKHHAPYVHVTERDIERALGIKKARAS